MKGEKREGLERQGGGKGWLMYGEAIESKRWRDGKSTGQKKAKKWNGKQVTVTDRTTRVISLGEKGAELSLSPHGSDWAD